MVQINCQVHSSPEKVPHSTGVVGTPQLLHLMWFVQVRWWLLRPSACPCCLIHLHLGFVSAFIWFMMFFRPFWLAYVSFLPFWRRGGVEVAGLFPSPVNQKG